MEATAHSRAHEMRNLGRDGFAILSGVFRQQTVERLIAAISAIGEGQAVRSRGGVFAVRNLLELSPAIRELANSDTVSLVVTAALGKPAFPVRGTLFDKTSSANWLVPWHQDLTICVASRMDAPGYGPWTTKSGVSHVQPPMRVLENMLSVRIHLDDCDESNGALRVLPGTHLLGRLTAAEIADRQQSTSAVSCAARRGDVVLMRPLLIHASSPAVNAAHRRVVHIDYACAELDGGLQWIWAPESRI